MNSLVIYLILPLFQMQSINQDMEYSTAIKWTKMQSKFRHQHGSSHMLLVFLAVQHISVPNSKCNINHASFLGLINHIKGCEANI